MCRPDTWDTTLMGYVCQIPSQSWFRNQPVCMRSLHLCLTLCNPMDCSPPDSSVWNFSRQEYWSGLPCPPPGNLPYPRIEHMSLMSPALAGRFFTTRATWEVLGMSLGKTSGHRGIDHPFLSSQARLFPVPPHFNPIPPSRTLLPEPVLMSLPHTHRPSVWPGP